MFKISLPERMLHAYVGLSNRLWNRRIPSAMTFNEAVVCHYLAQSKELGQPRVTATWLCEQTQIAKSQMNRILTRLEEQKLIHRTRSEQDRREILLELDDEQNIFHQEHSRIIALAAKMQAYFGVEKSLELTVLLEEFVEMLRTTEILEKKAVD